MYKNGSMNAAKSAKYDEFFTRFEDIEEEVEHYTDSLRGKIIYCNCDDPCVSKFWSYFCLNFDRLCLKKVVSTHIDTSNETYILSHAGGGDIKTYLKGNGDFRSDECQQLLDECDIVVTNPPFSLFREYVSCLMNHDKKFLIVGNMNAVSYKEFFSLIKSNRVWFGYKSCSKDMYFNVPDDYRDYLVANKSEGSAYKVIDGTVMARLASSCWFTNLDQKKRHNPLILTKSYYESPVLYQKYDNYDAINVNKVKDIPRDYYGAMGVPVSFLEWYCPDQFEILGVTSSSVECAGETYTPWKVEGKGTGTKASISGRPLYVRLLIRRNQNG